MKSKNGNENGILRKQNGNGIFKKGNDKGNDLAVSGENGKETENSGNINSRNINLWCFIAAEAYIFLRLH